MASAPKRSSFNWWGTLRLNLLIAIGVFLLLLATNQAHPNTEFVIRTLLTTLLYTFCIGTMALYVISMLIEPAPFPNEAVGWCLVILSSLGLAIVGSFVAETILVLSGLFPDQTFGD